MIEKNKQTTKTKQKQKQNPTKQTNKKIFFLFCTFSYTTKLLFYQSRTKHSDWTVTVVNCQEHSDYTVDQLCGHCAASSCQQ